MRRGAASPGIFLPYGNEGWSRLECHIAKTSDNPLIPNFEILGRIGGGAYGEVYLARSVTGMYRAVKVVRREDFEYERTFEREFEGIQRYEKVSQNHPGLVDVLHVGRDDAAGHYYYVMELADEEGGEHQEIDVNTYKPRTLSSDLRRKRTRSVRECVDLGLSMAGALGHLHHAGLTHRDVKPSNIIFVKGMPKLADVGLVASTGQRTFVGTEGYVPPEGPGTSSADLYSLAMVLYEMHTGKDRLDFPELPTNMEIPPTVNRDEWRALNAVICRAGSPDPRKRFESAHALARALQGVCAETGFVRPGGRQQPLTAAIGGVFVFLLLSAVGFGAYWLWRDNQSFVDKHGPLLVESGASTEKGNRQVMRPKIPIQEIVVESDPVSDGTVTGSKGGSEKGATKGESDTLDPSAKKGEGDSVVIRDDVAVKTDPTKEEGTALMKETVVEGDKPAVIKPTVIVANPVENQISQGQVKIMSQPGAASVWSGGEEIGITGDKLFDFNVGPVEITLKRDGYHDYVFRGEIREGTQVITAALLPDLGPIPGNPWINSLGMEFLPVEGTRYISRDEVSITLFDQFLGETGKEIPRAGVNGIVQVSGEPALWEFCDWLTEKDRSTGHLGPKRYYRPRRNLDDARKNSFFCSLEEGFGTLILNSDPPGAKIYRRGVYLDETPAVINGLRLGSFELELFKPGYEVAVAMGDLASSEAQDLIVELERDASVVFGERWTNSQGMDLVPFENLQVAIFETPLRAYGEFLSEGVPLALATAPLAVSPGHPATGVSYAEAIAFCDWLTRKERALNLIRPWQKYRLPTDLEWSRMAGLMAEQGDTPEARNHPGNPVFPWGTHWPPPAGAGNYADMASSIYFGRNIIEGYTDGFDRTSPSGTFAPSAAGIFDLSGNVWEWVSDPFTDGRDGLQVVRGGGWNSSDEEVLSTGYRNPVPASAKEEFYGFRYVLEDAGSPD